jgi:hypothetical protein
MGYNTLPTHSEITKLAEFAIGIPAYVTVSRYTVCRGQLPIPFCKDAAESEFPLSLFRTMLCVLVCLCHHPMPPPLLCVCFACVVHVFMHAIFPMRVSPSLIC